MTRALKLPESRSQFAFLDEAASTLDSRLSPHRG
jgi:hypothetical protein